MFNGLILFCVSLCLYVFAEFAAKPRWKKMYVNRMYLAARMSFVYVAVRPCLYEPCKNGGTCFGRGYYYKCKCPATHRGRNCEESKRTVSNTHWILRKKVLVKIVLYLFYFFCYVIRYDRVQIDAIKLQQTRTNNNKPCLKNWTRLLCLITLPKIEQYQQYLTYVIVHRRLILCHSEKVALFKGDHTLAR